MTRMLDHRPSRPVRLALVGAACASFAIASTAQAESPRHYAYVASSGPGTFLDPVIEGQNNPAGRPAASGHFTFKPVRKTFTLRLDDAAVDSGRTLSAFIVQDDQNHRNVCLRDGDTVTIAGFAPGRAVTVFVRSGADDLRLLPRRCDAHATTGSAFVGL